MEWCLEFFSSLAVKKEISNEEVMTDKFMRFRLGGIERKVTIYEFGKLLGIYSEEEMKSVHFERLVTDGGRMIGNFDANAFWKEISGEDVIVYGKKRVWTIKDPLLQVLHKIMVKSIFHISHYEQYVLDLDLWVLYVFVRDNHLSTLNLTWLLAQHLGEGAVSAGGAKICSGHLVTRIAKNLGLFNEDEMKLFGEPELCKPLGIKSFSHLREADTGKLKGLPEVLKVVPLNEL